MFKSTTTRPIAEAYHIFVLYKHVLHTILEESCFWCSPLHLINQAFITNLGIYFNKKTYTEKNLILLRQLIDNFDRFEGPCYFISRSIW